MDTAFTDVSNGKRGIVDKGKCTITYLEPGILTPVTALGHIHHQSKIRLYSSVLPVVHFVRTIGNIQTPVPSVGEESTENKWDST